MQRRVSRRRAAQANRINAFLGGSLGEWAQPTPDEAAEIDRRIEERLRSIGRHDLADKRAARRAQV